MSTTNDVLVITGAGGIGQAIARRQGPGKHILLADISEDNQAAAAAALEDLGHRVSTQRVDVSSRESVHALAEKAAELGNVTQVVHTAGVSPVQASAATVLAVDLLGTALVLARPPRHRIELTEDEHGETAERPPSASAEVWVVQDGQGTFFLGERQARIVRAGEVVRIPANTAWRVESTGDGPLRGIAVGAAKAR